MHNTPQNTQHLALWKEKYKAKNKYIIMTTAIDDTLTNKITDKPHLSTPRIARQSGSGTNQMHGKASTTARLRFNCPHRQLHNPPKASQNITEPCNTMKLMKLLNTLSTTSYHYTTTKNNNITSPQPEPREQPNQTRPNHRYRQAKQN